MLTPANAGVCAGTGGGGFTGLAQFFEYTFTGAEGTHFVVTLPLARVDLNYGVEITGQTEPDTFTYSYDTKTLLNFMVRTSAQVPAGRKITLWVAELQ